VEVRVALYPLTSLSTLFCQGGEIQAATDPSSPILLPQAARNRYNRDKEWAADSGQSAVFVALRCPMPSGYCPLSPAKLLNIGSLATRLGGEARAIP